MKNLSLRYIFLCVGLLISAAIMSGQTTSMQAAPSAKPSPASGADNAKTDPSYKLIAGDMISVSIFNEPDLSISQKLDTKGTIRLALVGEIQLSGKNIREAEYAIESFYIERRMLKSPMATVTVFSYMERDLSILGAVRSPGKMPFPPEKSSMDIVDVITRAGGFLPTAKSDAVKISHTDANGVETTSTINVEVMFSRRGTTATGMKSFMVYPGDRIWVDERLF